MAAEGSLLVLEDYFSSENPQFHAELRILNAGRRFGPFAEKWIKDARPWARQALRDTLLNGAFENPLLRPLVKRLFQLAEAAGDDEAMAWFAVAADRSVRRAESRRWNWSAGTSEPCLVASHPPRNDGLAFSLPTRRYLRRRAWRYFRRLGHRDPKRYLAAVLRALLLYRDEDVDSGVHLLDNWSLTHILFHHSPILEAHRNGWLLKAGEDMKSLKPTPAYATQWDDDSIFRLLLQAQARPLRRTARAMLQARPSLLEKVPFERVFQLLEHSDPELQALGLDLLANAAGLESAPLEAWNRLLDSRNLDVLDAVCAMMTKVVSPDRFSTDRLLAFATAPLGPIARLGLDWLKARALTPPELLQLAQVRAHAAAKDAVALAREKLGALPDFNPDWVLAFLDSTTREIRLAAWTWFSEEKRARHRLDLWAKLVETPYDDVRISIVSHLERFAEMDTALRVLLARAPLETVWATVLLNIHRGNRAKRLAAGQIAAAIERDPARAPQLLPLLAAAARSIRAPEFRAGLASVVRTATRRPDVADQIMRHFPELKLAP